MHLMTLNAMGSFDLFDRERYESQVKALKEIGADVVCLQEVWDPMIIEIYRAQLSDYEIFYETQNSLPRLLKMLVKGLPLKPGLKGVLLGTDLGLAILVKKKWLSTNHGGNNLKAEYRKLKSRTTDHFGVKFFEWLRPKGFMKIDCEMRGAPITIVNGHFSHGWTCPGRLDQFKAMYDSLADKRVVFFCGDLNAPDDQPEILWLESMGFRDCFKEQYSNLKEAPYSGATWHNKNPLTQGVLQGPDQRIDYIFYKDLETPSLKMKETKIVFDKSPVSDHYGILSTFELMAR